MSQPTRPPSHDLPGVIETADEGDRPSITEVNGSVAHFEMAYNPNPHERFAFGPPLWQRLPSLLFLGFGAAVAVAAVIAHYGNDVALHRFIVTEHRTPFAVVIAVSAIATFIRSGLRGVVVTRDGVETRTLSLGGVPRVRRWRWAQIDRVILDEGDVLFELWNGTYERLPKVREGRKMVDLLERVAIAHGRNVTRLDRRR